MMKLLLPLVLALVGTGAGVGAGLYLRPPPPEPEPGAEEEAAQVMPEEEVEKDREYVKLNNQFVIPVVQKDKVASLVVMSLSVETLPGFRDEVFRREPKLRDSFLRVLFDHANVGGFRGEFTDHNMLEILRRSLREAAIADAGDFVTDVLILEIARQDY